MAKSKTNLEALRMAAIQRKKATLDLLAKKRPVEKTVTVVTQGDDGPEELELLFRAIGSSEYDRLVGKFPPRPDQKKEGLTYDIDRFAPALISRVCVDPPMSDEDAVAIWTSEDWNRSEVMSLFMGAIDVCTSGLEPGPTSSD